MVAAGRISIGQWPYTRMHTLVQRHPALYWWSSVAGAHFDSTWMWRDLPFIPRTCPPACAPTFGCCLFVPLEPAFTHFTTYPTYIILNFIIIIINYVNYQPHIMYFVVFTIYTHSQPDHSSHYRGGSPRQNHACMCCALSEALKFS